MSIYRRTILDQLTLCRDTSVNVRLLKQVIDDAGEDEVVLAEVPHRFVVAPGGNFGEMLKTVNKHLTREGWGEVVAIEQQRIERLLSM